MVCSDVNECEAEPCGVHGNCSNAPGTFACECSPGSIYRTNISTNQCQGDIIAFSIFLQVIFQFNLVPYFAVYFCHLS